MPNKLPFPPHGQTWEFGLGLLVFVTAASSSALNSNSITITQRGLIEQQAARSETLSASLSITETWMPLCGSPRADDIPRRRCGLHAREYHTLGDINVRVTMKTVLKLNKFSSRALSKLNKTLFRWFPRRLFCHLKTSFSKCYISISEEGKSISLVYPSLWIKLNKEGQCSFCH